MLDLDAVLYPTDFSRCAEHALPYALFFAARSAADLHVLHALVLHGDDPGEAEERFPEIGDLYAEMGRWAERRLEETVAEAERPARAGETGAALLERLEGGVTGVEDVEIHKVQKRGISAGGVILDYAQDHDVDLVVMGTHGRRGLRHMLLGSVAEEVVRRAPCPVLTVPERSKEGPERGIRSVLVPVDFSKHADVALSHGKELADDLGAELQVLHVVEEIVYPDAYAGVTPAPEMAPEEAPRDRARKALERRLQEVPGPEVAAEVRVEIGRAHTRIPEFAEEEGSDLIVIASHGLTGFERVLLGSVTERVIRRASCPVLTVKSPPVLQERGGAD